MTAKPEATILEQINCSLDFDQRLAHQDVANSKAHIRMLAECGIVSWAAAEQIIAGLSQIDDELREGRFPFRRHLEDIHMNIEVRLSEIVGAPTAGYLATARSRNDQVATDLRLWIREAIDQLDTELQALQRALLDRAEQHVTSVMPGYTHLQAGQPVTLGHHLMAYVEMFGRDRSRLHDARKRLNECPLGSGALAGTSFPIDRDRSAHLLGFDRPNANSMDAVSDRDFALDYLAAAAIGAVHLSRLGEELILWTCPQFDFVRLGADFTTGSSIMPQKRNPDAAELTRAKAAIIGGRLNGLLNVLKGLPLTYSKDLQEDKSAVFQSTDDWLLSIKAVTGMIRDMQVRPEVMRQAAGKGFATATDLADWLVKELRLPFRRAHGVVRELALSEQGRVMQDLSCLTESDITAVANRLAAILDSEPATPEAESITPAPVQESSRPEWSHDQLERAVRRLLDLDQAVASRDSLGGTAPQRVCLAIAEARRRYGLEYSANPHLPPPTNHHEQDPLP